MNKSGQFYIFSSFISLFLSITVVTAVFHYHLHDCNSLLTVLLPLGIATLSYKS